MFIYRSKLMALEIKGARVPWDMDAVKELFIEYQNWHPIAAFSIVLFVIHFDII